MHNKAMTYLALKHNWINCHKNYKLSKQPSPHPAKALRHNQQPQTQHRLLNNLLPQNLKLLLHPLISSNNHQTRQNPLWLRKNLLLERNQVLPRFQNHAKQASLHKNPCQTMCCHSVDPSQQWHKTNYQRHCKELT